jgi:hypothetical protein
MRSILFVALALGASLVKSDKALLSLYSVASEAEESGNGVKDTWLRTCDGQDIVKVTKQFAELVRTDGKGRLEDGTLIYQACSCKKV